jgi:hypothetical protein
LIFHHYSSIQAFSLSLLQSASQIRIFNLLIFHTQHYQVVHREDSYGAETLTLPEGTPEGQYLVTIELLPYEKLPETSKEKADDKTVTKSDGKVAEKSQELDSNGGEKAGSDEDALRGEIKEGGADKEGVKESKAEESLREDKEESTSQLHSQPSLPIAESKVWVPVPALPESSFSCNYSSSSRNRESVRERFGIVQGEGSVWVEWLVNASRGGSVSVGAMTAAAAGDPDARCVLVCA